MAQVHPSDLTYDPMTGVTVGQWLFELHDKVTIFPVGCNKVVDGLSVEPVSGEALRYLCTVMHVERAWRVDLPTTETPVLAPIDPAHPELDEQDVEAMAKFIADGVDAPPSEDEMRTDAASMLRSMVLRGLNERLASMTDAELDDVTLTGGVTLGAGYPEEEAPRYFTAIAESLKGHKLSSEGRTISLTDAAEKMADVIVAIALSLQAEEDAALAARRSEELAAIESETRALLDAPPAAIDAPVPAPDKATRKTKK